MSAPFRLTPDAERQLAEILDYVAADNEGAARRVKDALYSAMNRLADMPEIGHRREDLTERPVKFWSVYHYLVVYDPVTSPLTVVAVLHGARDVGHLLKHP
jgi:plasmid stabilization system protein ParE